MTRLSPSQIALRGVLIIVVLTALSPVLSAVAKSDKPVKQETVISGLSGSCHLDCQRVSEVVEDADRQEQEPPVDNIAIFGWEAASQHLLMYRELKRRANDHAAIESATGRNIDSGTPMPRL